MHYALTVFLIFNKPLQIVILALNLLNDSLTTSQTRQLDYYSNKGVTSSNYANAIKKYGGSAELWSLRSSSMQQWMNFTCVNSTGGSESATADVNRGISPAFRIG